MATATGTVQTLAAMDDNDAGSEVDRLRAELEQAEDREAALHDVIATIARSTFDLDAVLQTVIDRAVKL